MSLQTEPIGSIPRSPELIAAMKAGTATTEQFDQAVRETIRRFEETGSSVITDGEQRKPSFVSYPIHGLTNLRPGGVVIPFKDGHTRQLPALAAGPFKYATYSDAFLRPAKALTTHPVKQAVISASAISLLYPSDGIAGYSREAFIEDVVREAEADIRRSLDAGADSVQIDFTEGRLSLKLDPSQGLLDSLVGLNNRVLERFTPEQRRRIGVHTCPGGDQDSTHSADVDYTSLLPALFRLKAGRFYLQLSSEADPERALAAVKKHAPAEALIFVGVTDPISARVETPEVVRDRILQAAKYIDPSRLGSTDDCGFSPFGDDTSTSRDTAFAKIRARVLGTELASKALGR